MEPRGPAELTEAVKFQRRADTDDAYGNTKGDWSVTLIAKRSAKLRPTRGGEQVIAARQQGVAMFDLWVRFESATRAVTTDDRVVELIGPARDQPGRTFNIKFIGDMTGRRTWLLMQLEQGTADG